MKDFTPIHDSIMSRRDLAFGAKCLFGRLYRYGQKDGKIFPSKATRNMVERISYFRKDRVETQATSS